MYGAGTGVEYGDLWRPEIPAIIFHPSSAQNPPPAQKVDSGGCSESGDRMTACSVLRRYLNHGLWPFLRAWVRLVTAPVTRVAAYLPKNGTTVDVGCGQGHFLEYCRLTGMQSLVGIEPSARATGRARDILPDGIAIVRAHAAYLPLRRCTALVALDVLYLMSPEDQISFIRHASSILDPEGVLLIKTMDPTRRVRQTFNILQEFVAVRIFRITLGSSFHFRTPGEWIHLLEEHDLKAQVIPMCKWFIHPHILIIGRRGH